jgi:biopolymer transport protein ExbD
MARRSAPEVNAGSMADIAFLLLIFFLVTTTIEVDSGIASKLPPPLPENTKPPLIKEKNIFQVVVNAENRLLVEDKDMEIGKLTDAAVKFLDNGGGTDPRNICSYCRGDKDPESSDNPIKAIISLVNDRQTSYKMYLAVTNELVRAYAILRDREAKRLYNETYQSMTNRFAEWPATEKENNPEYDELDERINNVQELFPRNLSEAEPQNRD